MTLQELYSEIGGNYEQATRVLRVEKLIDKHIRKLTKNGVVDNLLNAGESLDPTQMFETAHAMKGVCANLGLARLADAASEIAEEYRPGTPRELSDSDVKQRLEVIRELYAKTKDGINKYSGE